MSGVQGRLSVVVPNYNYGAFIRDSVQSALDLDWPDVEVIVVDDGSTDDSLELLESFGTRITVLRQSNSGPRVACNRGFAASTGERVVFLDSDDVLEPALPREADAVWTSAVSKTQVLMQRVDEDGVAFGRPFPELRRQPTPEEMRYWLTSTSAYPTPPGSGNVYSRWFLDKLFPLDDQCGDSTDSACLVAAPVLGDVVTVMKPLARYRIHGRNRSLLSSPERFAHQIHRARQRQRFATAIHAEADEAGSDREVRRSRHLLQLRVAHYRLDDTSTPTVPGDSRGRLLMDSLTSPMHAGPEQWARRAAVTAWCLVVLTAPGFVARRLISARFPTGR